MRWILFLLFLCFGNHQLFASEQVPDNILTIKENSINLNTSEGIISMNLELVLKEGFFAYKDKFELKVEGFETESLKIDPIVSFFDKTFQKTKEGVKNKATINAILQPTTQRHGSNLKFDLVYQACTEEYCLFPAHIKSQYKLSSNEKSALQLSQAPELLKKGLFLSLIFIFLAGFLTSLTPCVYPMLPITLAVLGTNKTQSKLQGFLRSFIYVIGMSTTYSILGVIAATTGFMFGSLLSNIYFLVFLGGVLFVGALSMFEVFEIQTPYFLQKKLNNNNNSTSYLALFITGVLSGLIVGPCVGPVLIGVLSYVSQTRDLFLGFILLFSFSLGMGSLIIVLGSFSGLIDKLPRSGTWMVNIKRLLGLSFLILILYFFSPILKLRDLCILALILISIFSFVIYLKLKKLEYSTTFEKSIFMTVFIFCFVFSVVFENFSHERFERLFGYSAMTFANTKWDIYTDEKLDNAKDNNQYVILDFYADWCAACRELKHKTFSDKRIINFSDEIKWLYFDSTTSTPKLEELKTKYNIIGLPTILLFDKSGNVVDELTLTGFEPPEQFIERLKKLIKGK